MDDDTRRHASATATSTYAVALGTITGGMTLYGPFTKMAALTLSESINETWAEGSENNEVIELRRPPRAWTVRRKHIGRRSRQRR